MDPRPHPEPPPPLAELKAVDQVQEAAVGAGPSAPDLADLVRRAREGEHLAQEGIIRAFETRVLRLAGQMMGNRADAEDVAQEVFLRLFRRLERLDPRRDPTGWVVRVTVRACWDHLALRQRQAEGPLVEEAWESSLPGPSAVARQTQQRDILRRSLQLLSPRERAVFILHEVDGEEVAAISAALRITRITVRRHLSRARLRLREHLAAMYPQVL